MKRVCLLIVFLLHAYLVAYSCTIITAAMNGEVLAGGNEDYNNPFIRMWFNPRTKHRYGSVCFGFPDLQPQAAMNEHGLFFDFTAQEGIDPGKLNLKNPFDGDLTFEILGKCRNIKEVLDFLRKYDYAFSSQALIADATGRSLIINAGIIIEKTGTFQINTNFNICHLKARNFNCWRYELAEKELSQAKQISVGYFKDLLKKTSQEGMMGTLYSNIYDLKRGVVYSYLYRNFDEPYRIDLKEELSKGYRIEELSSHFKNTGPFYKLVMNHPEYQRESILRDIGQKGLEATLMEIETLKNSDPAKKDKVNEWMTDAALVLIRNAYNKHSSGGWWHYFQDFPSSYDIWTAGNDLQQAKVIFDWLLKTNVAGPPDFFHHEMSGYIEVMRGNHDAARRHYREVLGGAPTESGSYKRTARMLAKMHQ